MNKHLISILIASIVFLSQANQTLADFAMAEDSASLQSTNTKEDFDYREGKLRSFLAKHNSPLTDSADEFVKYADKYDLDWRLVPAISGVESTFGKRIPQNSYNAYGWANGKYSFESWDESIEVVNKTLREKYIDKGAKSIDQIARRYAPPSNTWGGNVKFFMNKIDPIPVEFTL